MALTDKDILITPNRGQTADPKIEFKGADATLGPQTISLNVYPTDNGTVSFEGSAGQLFSITNTLSGTIYSVNDVSGIPSIEVLDTGLIKLGQYGGNILLGTGTDNGTDKLQVTGSAKYTGKITVGTFPNSTVNSGEAWFGRASDRTAGTFTIQLGTNASSVFEIVDYNWSKVLFSMNQNGSLTSYSGLNAPIFYDSNDSSYYVNPASDSVLNTFKGKWVPSSGTTTLRYESTNELNHYNSGGTAGQALYINYNAGNGGDTHIAGTKFSFIASTGVGIAAGSWRSQVFYDYNDTAYYGDFASTSTSLNIAGGISTPTIWVNYSTANNNGYNENIRLYPATNNVAVIAYGASGASGTPWNSTLGYSDRFEIRQGDQWQQRNYADYVEAYGSFRAPIFYDSNDTNYYGDFASTSYVAYLGRRAHNTGHFVGSYNSVAANDSKTNPIYTIGSSYNPNDADLSNMYGIGYSHPNATFISTPGFGGGWGLYVAADGDARVWLEASNGRVEAVGDMRAPIYYDRNNTAYYADPASNSVFNTLTLGGYAQNNPVENYWQSTTPSIYDATNGMRFYWVRVCRMPTEGYVAIEFESKTDANYAPYVRAVLSVSTWNATSISCQFDLVTPESISSYVAIDNNNDVWIRADASWNSYLRWRFVFNNGATIWDSANWQKTEHTASLPATNQVLIPGQSVRTTYGNVTAVTAGASTTNKFGNIYVRATGEAVTDFRAPIFYDSANTAYYTDPAGTSNLLGLTVTNTITGNISGNAATATSASNIDGVAFNNSNSGNAVSAPDTLDSNGIGYVTNISLFSQTDGALYSQAYSSSWQHQIYGDYRTGQIAIRGKNNGTWQAWRTIWDSSNLTNLNQLTNGPGYITGESDTLATVTGRGASTATAITLTGGLNINSSWEYFDDWDRDAGAAKYAPNSQTRATRWQFANASTANSGGNYAGVLHFHPWTGTTASTGDASYQLSFGSTAANGGGVPKLSIRKGIDTTWNSWYTISLYDVNSYSSALYATVYYDADDTNYYLDPNSHSRLVKGQFNWGSASVTAGPTLRVSKGWDNGIGNYAYDTVVVESNDVATIRVGEADGTQGGMTWGDSNTTFTSTHPFRFYTQGTAGSSIYSGMEGTFGFGITGGYGYSNGSLRAPIFYDSDDTGYYVDPNNGSNFNWTTTNNSYTNGWFRNNNSGQGLYNQATSQHWYSDSSAYWNMGANSSGQGIRFRDTHAGTIRGYVYYDNGNNVGFLNQNGDWRLRIVNGDWSEANGSSMRAALYYDIDDTGYYVDPNSTSRMNYVVPTRIKCVNNVNNEPRWDFSAYVVEAQHWYGNNSSMTMYLGESSSNVVYMPDIRPYILYDRDDTDCYVNPRGHSKLKDAGSASSGNVSALEIKNLGGTGDGDVAAISWHCAGYWGLQMHLRHDGYFGIGGWSASTWRWYVDTTNGNMTAAGNVTAYSDVRLKEEIRPIENPLSKILSLNGVNFKWKNLPDIVGSPGKQDVGILAHEVEAVAPEAVAESPHISPDGDPYKTVAYDKLVPILIEAIKEQQTQIEELKSMINTLLAKNKE